MYKKTLDAFGKFFDAYTKKEFSKYNEKQTFEELCNAMRLESQKIEEQRKKSLDYITEKRKDNPTYAREKAYQEKRKNQKINR